MPTTWTSLVFGLAARAALRPRLALDLVRTDKHLSAIGRN